jgi:hypothetical protein
VSFGGCAPNSRCISDRFEYPTGQCHRIACTLGDDTTCAGDGRCVAMAAITTGVEAGTACVDRCTSDGDCRVAYGYRCVDGGLGVGRYCRHTHAGDPCAMDEDGGVPGEWDCKTGPTFPAATARRSSPARCPAPAPDARWA